MIAADTDIQHRTHFTQTKFLVLPVNLGVLHTTFLAKYALVFLGFHTHVSIERSHCAIGMALSAPALQPWRLRH